MLKKTFIIATLFQAAFLVSNTEECGFLLKLMKRDEISGNENQSPRHLEH